MKITIEAQTEEVTALAAVIRERHHVGTIVAEHDVGKIAANLLQATHDSNQVKQGSDRYDR